ncbi:hypothetical protein RQN30_06830 [Arcanobacterium hippocoleae]
MATISVAAAMITVALLALITVQYLNLPNQISRTQNYADLAAISAAQLIQNGTEMKKICKHVGTQVSQDSAGKVYVKECGIEGENVRIKVKYAKILSFLEHEITAEARAGPASG